MRRFCRDNPVLVTIPLLLLGWFVVAHAGLIGRSLVASPQEVFTVLANGFHPASPAEAIYRHAFDSILRGLSGWAIALLLGSLIGLALGLSTTLYRSCEPVFEFARAIPPIMAFPLLLVAFNFGPSAYVWTIATGCLPIMVLSVSRGMQNIDQTRQDLLAAHGAPRALRLAASAVEVLPSVLFGARLTFSISLIVTMVTEMVFGPRSGFALGALAKDSQISFDTPTFYACILILGIYGYLANQVMRQAEWRLSGEKRRAS